MEDNLEQLRNSLNALNEEYSKKTAELFAEKEVKKLNKQIFEIDVYLENLYGQKNSGVWAISNSSRKKNNQQHRIARINLCLQVIILIYYLMAMVKLFHFQ